MLPLDGDEGGLAIMQWKGMRFSVLSIEFEGFLISIFTFLLPVRNRTCNFLILRRIKKNFVAWSMSSYRRVHTTIQCWPKVTTYGSKRYLFMTREHWLKWSTIYLYALFWQHCWTFQIIIVHFIIILKWQLRWLARLRKCKNIVAKDYFQSMLVFHRVTASLKRIIFCEKLKIYRISS